jgi:hypothetical protein
MKGVLTLKDLLEKNGFAASFDLKSLQSHASLSHFLIIFGNLLEKKKLLFCFVGIFFSLSDTQRVFTIIIKKLLKR